MLGSHSLDGLVDRETVADAEPLQEHGLRAAPAGCHGGPPFAPDTDAVIPHQVDQHDGQEGGERAPPFPTREDAIVSLDELEHGPRAEFLGLVLGQAAEPAETVEPLTDELEVLFEERSPLGRRDTRQTCGARAGKGLKIGRDFNEVASHLRTSKVSRGVATTFRRPDSPRGGFAVLWKSFRKAQETREALE